MKKSYTLSKDQAENPRVLGARPRETGNSAKAYPSLPNDLEETIETRLNRTVTIDKKANEGANAVTNQIMM